MSGCTASLPLKPIVVLASQSPNRLKLIQQIGITPIVRISNFDENLRKGLPVVEFVQETAIGKLLTILEEMQKNGEQFSAIIACDTVIEFEGEIIGKPVDAQDAMNTLKRFRGQEQAVYTGVAIAFADGSQDIFYERTDVQFGDYSDETIEKYVATGEPLNKAGSYGIGQMGAVFVAGIKGCFSNVVGLPIYKVHHKLAQKGII